MQQWAVAVLAGFLYVKLVDQFLLRLSERVFCGLTYHVPDADERLIANKSNSKDKDAEVPLKELGDSKLITRHFVDEKWPVQKATLDTLLCGDIFRSYVSVSSALFVMFVANEVQYAFKYYGVPLLEVQDTKLSQVWLLLWACYSVYLLASLLFIHARQSSVRLMAAGVVGMLAFWTSWVSMEMIDGVFVDFGLEDASKQLSLALTSLRSALKQQQDLPSFLHRLGSEGMSKTRFFASIAMLSALMSALLVYPGLRFAKSYLMAVERPQLHFGYRFVLRLAASSPFFVLYFMTKSASDSYSPETRFIVLAALLVIQIVSVLIMTRQLIQAYLDIGLLRQKLIASQPKEAKTTLQAYRNMIMFVFQSSTIAALQLIVPVCLLAALSLIFISCSWTPGHGLFEASVTGPEFFQGKDLNQLDPLAWFRNAFPSQIWASVVKFYIWWFNLSFMLISGFGITFGRAANVNAIPGVE